MSNRFMISVAAVALIAGTSFANAQGGMSKESGGGAAMQHSDTQAAPSKGETSEPAKSEKSESAQPKGTTKSTQSEPKSPGAMKNDRAEDSMKGGSTSQRSEDRSKGATPNQQADDSMKNGSTKPEGRDNSMKADGRDNNVRDNNMKAEGKNGTNAAETKGAPDAKGTTTTGQAGAGAKLTTEQRTQVTNVIRNQHVENVTNVNFSVSVGTRVPREGVRFYPLPTEVVTIYPEWRGYEFILVNGRIVIIEPASYEIVAVLDA